MMMSPSVTILSSPACAPRSPRRRVAIRIVKLALLFSVFLILGGFGWNWWSYARLDHDYHVKLQEYVREHPRDSEGWFALATCLDRATKDPDFGFPTSFDRSALQRAIEIDPRLPFGLAYAWNSQSGELPLAVVQRHEDDAMLNMIVADAKLEEGDLEAARSSALRVLSAPRASDPYQEAIQIHRRFARHFFGDGYEADSLILRHEFSAPMSSRVLWSFPSIVKADAGRMRATGDQEGARKLLMGLHEVAGKIGWAEGVTRYTRWIAARSLCELSVEQGTDEADSWRSIAEENVPAFSFT